MLYKLKDKSVFNFSPLAEIILIFYTTNVVVKIQPSVYFRRSQTAFLKPLAAIHVETGNRNTWKLLDMGNSPSLRERLHSFGQKSLSEREGGELGALKIKVITPRKIVPTRATLLANILA